MQAQHSLAQIFSGREDCLGLYHLEGSSEPGKKWEGRAISYPNSKYPDRKLLPVDYELHFNGKIALGIVPVQLDGTCRWMAIDVDDYALDHTALAKQIFKKQLPIVHCRSKSGGAHLYGLFSEPIKATDAVTLARKWCIDLGFDAMRTEVFPKQTKFDSPEAKGNWIIIPYFGGKQALDYAIDDNGKKVDFKDFDKYCIARLLTRGDVTDLLKSKKKVWSSDEILEQSPPCIISMMEQKFKEGDGRNNASSHLAWYYRSLDTFFETDDWKDKLSDFNNEYFDPPMGYREINQVIQNHSGGKYKARCEINPMVVLCDKPECLKRKFGIKPISELYGDFQFSSLTKIDLGDDPIWKPFINGHPVSMDTSTFLNPRGARQAILAKTNILIPVMRQAEWDAVIAPLIKNALVIEQADLVSSYGKIESCFKQWIAQTIEKSRDKLKLLDGLPFYDKKESQILFRMHDFVLEYRRVYKENTDDKELYMVMKSTGFWPHKIELNKRKVEVMVTSVPSEDAWFKIPEEEAF